ncbi:MAG TPA: hypothetical protein VMI06_07085, partial [Terriglobia bacterium]|nr:hypothetical protein [Terriglobia bacterium]
MISRSIAIRSAIFGMTLTLGATYALASAPSPALHGNSVHQVSAASEPLWPLPPAIKASAEPIWPLPPAVKAA